ncbi:MAG TPA: thioredoxin domain-containing protein [Bacteroidota bacterium]|nr:thioredoxin domain-containing protein [Bacteroidota bacterium]
MHSVTGKSNTASAFVEEELRIGKKPNALISEKSPYLLQHAFNPVDWLPWGDAAFEKARAENKPVFVSIGYSTCYWCHVMEREVFEDTAIARLMNEHLVCIKVDREERPDIDRIYMSFVQAMTGSGGWPLSVFMTPDRKPFFGGTYFPPIDNYGRPGFPTVVKRITDLWTNNRAKLVESSEEITRQMQASSLGGEPGVFNAATLDTCYLQLLRQYDQTYGGFGGAPKFPRPVVFNFLLRYHARTGDASSLTMATATLRKMAEGGMYDQLGGGFHRYSVDERWRVPHFEKMLYDQAQLASSYIDAYQVTDDEFFARIARETLDYVLREMTDEHGGFYSAQDAESPDPDHPEQNEEGAVYLWSKAELDRLLGADAPAFEHRFGVADSGNALHDPQGVFRGKNILYAAYSLEETAAFVHKSVEEVRHSLDAAKQTLLAARLRRLQPHLDDKILTSWNGLMISAFARGYQVLGDDRYLDASRKSADFIVGKLYDANRRILLRRFRDGDARFDGTLEDYAFLSAGLTDLYEASFDPRWLETAVALTKRQNEIFWDSAHGAFFDVAPDAGGLLLQTKDDYDSAEPTGNSIAAMNLLRLGQITENPEWREMAGKTIEAFGGRLQKAPSVLPQLLCAAEWILSTPKEIVLAGKHNAADTQELLRTVNSIYLPNKIVILVDEAERSRVAAISPFVSQLNSLQGKATAFVCENYACNLPVTDSKSLADLLSKKPSPKP